jgi:hypothetical protein
MMLQALHAIPRSLVWVALAYKLHASFQLGTSRYTEQAYWVRANNKREQLLEILKAFSITVKQDDLLSRCTKCNGTFIPRSGWQMLSRPSFQNGFPLNALHG